MSRSVLKSGELQNIRLHLDGKLVRTNASENQPVALKNFGKEKNIKEAFLGFILGHRTLHRI